MTDARLPGVCACCGDANDTVRVRTWCVECGRQSLCDPCDQEHFEGKTGA